MYITLITFWFVIIQKVGFCDDDTTQWPNVPGGKKGANPGAARQIYGSSALRPQGSFPSTPSTPKSTKQTTNNNDDAKPFRPAYSHGILVTEPMHPGNPPPIVQQAYDASYRAVGGVRVPNGMIVPVPPGIGSAQAVDIYGSRSLGERQGDGGRWQTWDRYGQHTMNQNGGFVPHHPIIDPEEELMDPSDAGGSDIDANDCMLACLPTEYLCARSCMCIPKHTKCDGQVNCEDGEDEENCNTSNDDIIKEIKDDCESTGIHVMCPRTFTCIAQEWLCDGDDDCGDYSDETHCGARVNCSEDQFECQNGLCIQQSWMCDGDNDCKDFSDELNCTKLICTSQEYQCLNGNCVSASFRCDGDADCTDGSDELNCQLPMPDCPEDEFKCKGSVRSGYGQAGKCILQRFRCDGDNDCEDWSDEEGCPMVSSSCASTEFKCGDGTCIPERWRCDKEQDCDSGEDEKDCDDVNESKKTCGTDEFTCKDGRCIMQSWKCDGVADCPRSGEDETDCDSHCEIGQFTCPLSKNSSIKICVNQKHVCDGHKDCPNGEDERKCPTPKRCEAKTKCEQLCVTTADGQDECACKVGYTLHWNKLNCTDIDECQFTFDPVCSQECINTIGSFRCTCTHGYILRPDLRTCKALGGAVKLIMANRADIRQVSLSNNKYTSIVKGLHNVIAVDYHYKNNLLFWSDVSTDLIKMSFINGTGIRNVVKWGLESPSGVAIDWIHDLLFWTDSGTRRVEVSTFDGALRAVIAANDLDKPRAIVVHPGDAFVFWTDWGPNPKIERSYMDGTERKILASDGIFWPNGLSIDYPADRIYWADAKHHVIESCSYDGSERKKILSNNLPHPFALTIFEDVMYWTDWHTKRISAANKLTGKNFRNVHEGLHFPMDIHSYHPARQPDFPNRCALDRRGQKGGCSHLCLPNKTIRRCGCPIGLTLTDDQKTCTSVPDKILLIARKKDIRLKQLNSRMSTNDVDMVVPLDGIKSTVGLDWCSKTDTIYWTDVGRSAISKSHLNGSRHEYIIQTNLISPAGLALDWVTDKLYWTDSGTHRIEVSTIDGKKRALLIWKNLDKPRDIVVDPIDGLMFWSDWGSNPMIERAGMDGSNRKTLVYQKLSYPNGLAIDQSNSRLYFLDGGTKTLEYVNFDGTGRNTLISYGLLHPFGLDVYNNKVFWTDWRTQSLEMADKLTGKNRRTLISNTSDFMDVRVFHRERRDIYNPCSVLNGNCAHMCLLNPNGYTCSCPIGVKAINDRLCNNGPLKYIIFAHRIDIRQISLDMDYLIDVILPLPPISNAMAVDVDLQTGNIYWSDSVKDVIMMVSSDGQQIRQIISESMHSVDGLVVDSVGRKIYWTDVGRHTVEVSELDGKNRAVLIWEDLESPRGITFDYQQGLLFWTDWGLNPKIERAYMDGERRIKIVTSGLGWPNGLSLDPSEKRIYWTDAQTKHIESCDYDGNYRKIIVSNLPHPYGIAVTRDFLYWSDWKSASLHVLDKANVSSQKVIKSQLQGIMDVKIVEDDKIQIRNICGDNNGNCSHLCLRNPKGYSCKCPTGIKLIKGSKYECEEMPQEYLLIALRSGIGRISLDTNDMFDVVLPIDDVHGSVVLDFHYNQSKIIYADVHIDSIKIVDMKNMSDVKSIVSTGLHTPNGIAVDWLANNLYWSDSVVKLIEVARLDGTSRKSVIKTDLNDPRSVIVYPKRGYLFWTDWGKQRIERSFMDGSDRKSIVDSNLGFPTGLAIDFELRKLYWTDALKDRIEMCDFNGNKRTEIVQHATYPFGVSLSENSVFWTDWYNKSVFRASKNGSLIGTEIRHGLRGALDIRSVSAKRQPIDVHPCMHENGGCTHLCLFKGQSYICGCPDIPDNKICKMEPDFVVPFRTDEQNEYSDTEELTRLRNHLDSHDNIKNTSSQTRIVIIATGILGGLLIVVVTAILVLIFNSKRKQEKRSPRGSTRSVLTFANPNYNGADSGQSEPKLTIWKRLKYDKAQDRVYEEKCIGSDSTTATLNLITATPTPMPSPSVNNLPLSTIG